LKIRISTQNSLQFLKSLKAFPMIYLDRNSIRLYGAPEYEKTLR